MNIFFFFIPTRPSCECNQNVTQSSAPNSGRSNGNNANPTPVMLASSSAAATVASPSSCICGNLINSANGANANAFNMNLNNGAYNDANNAADTLLTSNAKFQAISAIAVSQDGVINVADQGKKFLLFFFFCSSSRCLRGRTLFAVDLTSLIYYEFYRNGH